LRNRGFLGTVEEFGVHNETHSLTHFEVTAKTALVFIKAPVPSVSTVCIGGQSQPLVRIRYSENVTALYPASTPGNWFRLLRPDNCAHLNLALPASSGVSANKPVRVTFTCKPVCGPEGRSITNGLFRVLIGNLSGDVESRAGSLTVVATVTQASVPIDVSLLPTNPSIHAPVNLADVQIGWSSQTQ
jgi:hypothetical protein